MALHVNKRVSKNSAFVRVLQVIGLKMQYTGLESLLQILFSAVLCEVISNTLLDPYDLCHNRSVRDLPCASG